MRNQILPIAALLLMVACKKNDSAKMSENQNPESNIREFIYNPPEQTDCKGKPCSESEYSVECDNCPGYHCCRIRKAGDGTYNYQCRKPGSSVSGYFVIGAIAELSASQANFHYMDVSRIYNNDTTILGSNLSNNLGSESEIVFLDDNLHTSWAGNDITYVFKLKNSAYMVFSTLTWTGKVSN